MEAVEVTSLKDRLVISIDKTLVSKDYLFTLLNRLRFEELARKASFDDSVMEISEEMKLNRWTENKENILSETYDCFDSSKSADEIIDEIKSSRHFNDKDLDI